LYEASGGNPGYLDALREPVGVPPAGILAELAALPAAARVVALAAAVAGDPFDPELVAAIAPVPVARALDTLDGLAARDLIRPEATARQFRFRHPLVREAAYHAAGGHPAGAGDRGDWRRAAHARAAAHLRERGAGAIVQAPHVEQGLINGDEHAIAVL